MGVSNDAATAAGCSNRVEHNFGDLADGVEQLGGTGSGRGSEERIFHGADGGEVGCGLAIKQVELAEVG